MRRRSRGVVNRNHYGDNQSSGATLTINGMAAQSGVASDPIDLVDIYTTIEIVVTAQDGTTKMTYTIEFYNQNLVEKTNNADLRSLKVNYGLMTPKFKPAVTEYEVTATEDTYSSISSRARTTGLRLMRFSPGPGR